MQFKIGKTNIKISFSFTALVLFYFISDKSNFFIVALLCAAIHEAIHIFFIYAFTGQISSISLNLFGADIKRRTELITSNIKEAVIAVSAPIFNLILFLIFNNSGERYNAFSQMNLSLGLVNILPFYSFDGGCFVKYLLLEKLDDRTTDKIVFSISLVIAILFCILSVYLSVTKKEFHLSVLISLFMVLSLVFKK